MPSLMPRFPSPRDMCVALGGGKARRPLVHRSCQTIIIVVEGGCVAEVKNLPDDWCYEIDDRDIDDDDTAD